MRILGLIVVCSLFLSSCGARKRAPETYKEPQRPAGITSTSTDVIEGDLPEGKGTFVYFPISGVEEYIAIFAPIAQLEMKAYGIPASITLAQGILESGYGQGELTRKTNNHFGIKCHTGWEGEYAHHDDDAKGECFRKYNHPMYSFRDHSIFLSSRSRYASLFDLPQDDYKAWARGLKAAGYATDRQYPQKLISFIERYQLDRFDREVLHKDYMVATDSGHMDANGIHVVQRGDTLYSLSRKYKTTVPELMDLNNLSTSNLSVGQKIRIRAQETRK